jgi:hypothetical protein
MKLPIGRQPPVYSGQPQQFSGSRSLFESILQLSVSKDLNFMGTWTKTTRASKAKVQGATVDVYLKEAAGEMSGVVTATAQNYRIADVYSHHWGADGFLIGTGEQHCAGITERI